MKKIILILTLFICTFHVYGQEKNDSVPKLPIKLKEDTTLRLNVDKQKLQPETVQPQLDLPQTKIEEEVKVNPILDKKAFDHYPLHLPPIELYVGPPTKLNHSHNFEPLNNYMYQAFYEVSPNFGVASISARSSLLGLGTSVAVGGYFVYDVTPRFELSGGMAVSQNILYEDRFKNVNFDFKAQFKLTDQLFLNGYAGYSRHAGINAMSPMMMNNKGGYYGGTIEYKFNKTIGVEAGMIRSINPFTGKWQNELKLAPVFYVK